MSEDFDFESMDQDRLKQQTESIKNAFEKSAVNLGVLDYDENGELIQAEKGAKLDPEELKTYVEKLGYEPTMAMILTIIAFDASSVGLPPHVAFLIGLGVGKMDSEE